MTDCYGVASLLPCSNDQNITSTASDYCNQMFWRVLYDERRLNFIKIVQTNLVSTSQRTYSVSVTNTNLQILFQEITCLNLQSSSVLDYGWHLNFPEVPASLHEDRLSHLNIFSRYHGTFREASLILSTPLEIFQLHAPTDLTLDRKPPLSIFI